MRWLKRILDLWFFFNKPNEMYYHNGNYDWTAKKLIGPIYILVKCEYNEPQWDDDTVGGFGDGKLS